MKTILTIMLAFIVSASFAQKKSKLTKADSDTIARAATSKIMDSTTTATYKWFVRTKPKEYSINWKKVKTLNDMKIIIQSLNITYGEGTTNFKKIKKYLIIAK